MFASCGEKSISACNLFVSLAALKQRRLSEGLLKVTFPSIAQASLGTFEFFTTADAVNYSHVDPTVFVLRLYGLRKDGPQARPETFCAQ